MTAGTYPGDDDLLRLTMAGDEEAFATLYRQRQGGVYRFALHMSGNAATAEEVTQEVFLTLLRDPGRYDPNRGSLPAFLYGIARHHLQRRLEGEQPYLPLGDECGNDGPAAQGDPLGELTRSEPIEFLRRAVLALPARYREVVVLCELQEMSYAEASAALGCSIGTVRSRLHRARALLAEKLRRHNHAGCLV